ncbi:DEAD-box ATP-dependent RNA helicase 32 [Ananas comosus]|uniref:ATP-dependent RNA helicase n=1 Tax=Ananas comosus TaxID=4615 RepID=A0A199UZC2_ANACO|nr:DEAD-box ATP-dependent RNA helicase 32 [Ananas comosus]
MDETPNFDCSQLQVLVLDEADRILDHGFREQVDAIISQIPRVRQTLLFSATQTKSVKDLARVSLKDPEYISVHAESVTATPERLKQLAMIVPLEQKLNMLWSFIRRHLKSKILVFLSSCKQVKFVYEAFKKLRPGIPLKCLHGRMKHDVRYAIYLEFCPKYFCSFFNRCGFQRADFPAVDWVVQVDCPEDIPTYIHRVGVLLVLPVTVGLYYFSAFRERNVEKITISRQKYQFCPARKPQSSVKLNEEPEEDDILLPKKTIIDEEGNRDAEPGTRVLKKKKLKINVHRPVGTRLKYDEEGNIMPPLAAAIAGPESGNAVLRTDKVKERYEKLRQEMKEKDKEDKILNRQRLREKRKEKQMKLKRRRGEEEEEAADSEDGRSELDEAENGAAKRSKIRFVSDDEEEEKGNNKKDFGLCSDSVSIAEQEALALKLLGSMHS